MKTNTHIIPIKNIILEMMDEFSKRMMTVNGMPATSFAQHSPEVITNGVHENIKWKAENAIHDNNSNNKEEAKHMANMNNAINLINTRFKGGV